jgi:hypothetical protein
LAAFAVGKLEKVNTMKTGEQNMNSSKTVKAKFVKYASEYCVELLHCLVTIGTDWTVALVHPTL